MKIENAKEATVTSNLPTGDVTNMSINLEGVPHLMNILTNLYTNPRLAVIREYVSNAWDAHVAVGNTAPVEVSLPSWDNPVYVVSDHGIGMSADDIRNIYAQYGASTKRESNNQIGAFGLGCKSALTITNQFTVISVKDGWKTAALISKTESGINSINIISHSDTDEANGTTVKIPVSGIDAFNREAEGFFRYVEEGIVLIDGKDPHGFFDSLTEIKVQSTGSSTYLSSTRSYSTEFVVVMGNVPYWITHTDLSSALGDAVIYRALSNSSVYFKAGIGEVDLTPNREGLRLTDKTNEFIKKQLSETYAEMRNVAVEEMDAIVDRAQCYKVDKKWSQYGFSLQWNGEAIPDRITSLKGIKELIRETDGYGSYTQDASAIYPGSWGIIVTDLNAADFGKVSRNLLAYTRSLDLSSATYYITDDSLIHTNKWVTENSNFTLITSEEITEAAKEQRKIERANRVATTPSQPNKIQYPVLDMATKAITLVAYTDIPDNVAYMAKETFYASNYAEDLLSTIQSYGYPAVALGERLHKQLEDLTDATHVVFIGKQRTASAFLGRVKGAYDLGDDVKKAYAKLEALQSDPKIIEENSLSDKSDVYGFRYLDLHKKKNVDQLLDDELRLALETTADGKSPEMLAVNELRNKLLQYRLSDIDLPEIPPHVKEIKLSERYPLISTLGWSSKGLTSEIITYINAVFLSKFSGLAETAVA